LPHPALTSPRHSPLWLRCYWPLPDEQLVGEEGCAFFEEKVGPEGLQRAFEQYQQTRTADAAMQLKQLLAETK